MYNELVKVLRNMSKMGIKYGMAVVKMREAADAIEELSCKETPMKIIEIHVDEYYCPACGAENNCDQGCVQDVYCPTCGQRLLPEPPKEE